MVPIDAKRYGPSSLSGAGGDAVGIEALLADHPAAGLAVGIVRDGILEFQRSGLADTATGTAVTEDTVFRIGSITKTFTAVAVMQLWEHGLIDLDAPAQDYLRSYWLRPNDRRWRPATVRHLLTHTAGVPDVVHVGDLLHPKWGPFGARPAVASVPIGEPLPSLGEYYRGGVPVVVEPGSAFAYSNHGFATLGQIVEDVSGEPLHRYFREEIFGPLGMDHSDLIRSDRVGSRLARGYVFGPDGSTEVVDRDWITTGASGVYSSSRDMGRYLAALLGGGSNEHGTVLRPETLAMMFELHYQTDPRLPGMGLGFFLHRVGGHRLIGHDGVLPGFNSGLVLAPDDAIGVFAATNGSPRAMFWLPSAIERLLCDRLGIAEEVVTREIPHRPEIWRTLSGRYLLPPVSDLRGRLAIGGGVRVTARGGSLTARLLTPIPALYRGFSLVPDDEFDPYAFRVDLSRFGMAPVRLVFEPNAGTRAVHTDLGGQPISLYEETRDRWPWIRAILGTVALSATGAYLRKLCAHSGARGPR